MPLRNAVREVAEVWLIAVWIAQGDINASKRAAKVFQKRRFNPFESDWSRRKAHARR
jgi:hypothetical protein